MADDDGTQEEEEEEEKWKDISTVTQSKLAARVIQVGRREETSKFLSRAIDIE